MYSTIKRLIRQWLRDESYPIITYEKDSCPTCGYIGFNAYGKYRCPQCGTELDVRGFKMRCFKCLAPLIGYGPAYCEYCNSLYWVGTIVQVLYGWTYDEVRQLYRQR